MVRSRVSSLILSSSLFATFNLTLDVNRTLPMTLALHQDLTRIILDLILHIILSIPQFGTLILTLTLAFAMVAC